MFSPASHSAAFGPSAQLNKAGGTCQIRVGGYIYLRIAGIAGIFLKTIILPPENTMHLKLIAKQDKYPLKRKRREVDVQRLHWAK